MLTDTPLNEKKNHSQSLFKTLLILLVGLGFITTFASGYILSKMFSAEQKETTKNQKISPSPLSHNPRVEQDTTKFLPGKYYFDDTLIAITKDAPHISLVATVTRNEQENNYTQSTRISYYDGSTWMRQSDSQTTRDATIVSNDLIKKWKSTIDPSRVLKQTVEGELNLTNTSLSFSTSILQNEIGVRSLPGYTKFLSNGTGTVTINGKTHQAYILYTRIYSLNASDIQFYNQALGITTDWLAFWDTQGNFYHVDATNVDKPTEIYQPHQIGIMENVNGAVTKIFQVTVTRDAKNPPTNYTVSLANPIGATLSYTRVNGVNKESSGSSIWYLGGVEGTVQKKTGERIKGIGLIEYIKD